MSLGQKPHRRGPANARRTTDDEAFEVPRPPAGPRHIYRCLVVLWSSPIRPNSCGPNWSAGGLTSQELYCCHFDDLASLCTDENAARFSMWPTESPGCRLLNY